MDSLPKTFCDQHKYLEDLSIHKNENNNSRKRDPPSISNLLQGKRESSCDDGKWINETLQNGKVWSSQVFRESELQLAKEPKSIYRNLNMKDTRLIPELLDYLYKERERIESTGHRVAPDLRKAYEFVNQEIQHLQIIIFENQYQQFIKRLSDLLENANAV